MCQMGFYTNIAVVIASRKREKNFTTHCPSAYVIKATKGQIKLTILQTIKKNREFNQFYYKQPSILHNKRDYSLYWSRDQGWLQPCNADNEIYRTQSIKYQWNDV